MLTGSIHAGILGDEMGLGKTIQAIATIALKRT
jgi:SNF2 family DNA or RNA helicase